MHIALTRLLPKISPDIKRIEIATRVEGAAKNLDLIGVRVQKKSPSTHIYLQSILPRSVDYRAQVEAFNSEIERLAAEMGVTYIDLYPHFLDSGGSIADEFSNDDTPQWSRLSIVAVDIEALPCPGDWGRLGGRGWEC